MLRDERGYSNGLGITPASATESFSEGGGINPRAKKPMPPFGDLFACGPRRRLHPNHLGRCRKKVRARRESLKGNLGKETLLPSKFIAKTSAL
jgi:hypothetical protein